MVGSLLAVVVTVGCREVMVPGDVSPPDSLSVEPLAMTAVRVAWTPVPSLDVINYRVERRARFAGEFELAGDNVPQPSDPSAPVVYIDAELTPDTYYGYRIIAVTRFGSVSGPSVVRAARTPPPPGVVVTTTTAFATARSADQDGYLVRLRGPADTMSSPIAVNGYRRFGPLTPGTYDVEIDGIAPQCALDGSEVPGRSAQPSAEGLHTVDTVRYALRCRDPSLGEITAIVVAEGDSLDADGYIFALAGVVSGDSLPDSLRAVSRTGSVRSPPGGPFTFANLRPGAYQVTLEGVAANCALAGAPARDVDVEPLSVDTVRFGLTCQGSDEPVDTAGKPYVWRNVWSAATATAGQAVRLDIRLDLTANPTQDVGTAQSIVRVDPAVLRYDSARTGGGLGAGFTANSPQPGVVSWLDYTTSSAPKGDVLLARVYYTVIGASGVRAITRTARQAGDQHEIAGGDLETRIDSMVRIVEDTLTVGTGGGGPNQAPTAQANGPYTGTTGSPVSFSSAGSSDTDGSITGYNWTFGDQTAAVTAASPQHTYAAAGAYTARLIVTDNAGAADTATANVTITPPGNQSPTARINGPYTGLVNTIVNFSSAGSSDLDGSIASFAWTFGDGGTSTSANPTHTYTATGSHPVTLTVTDNQGATNMGQTTATISNPSSGTPFTWSNTFTSNGATVTLTLRYDLSSPDIPETPGGEALGTWIVDSLKWNPAVLQFQSATVPNGLGSFNTSAASAGKLTQSQQGVLPSGAASQGLITIATITFTAIGATGATTTTVTALGPLIGRPSTGNYNYWSKTSIAEGTFIVP